MVRQRVLVGAGQRRPVPRGWDPGSHLLGKRSVAGLGRELKAPKRARGTAARLHTATTVVQPRVEGGSLLQASAVYTDWTKDPVRLTGPASLARPRTPPWYWTSP